MSVKYTLQYLPVAQEDLISIFDYIAQESPNRALAFVKKLSAIAVTEPELILCADFCKLRYL